MGRDTRSWEAKVHPVFKRRAEAFKEAIQSLDAIGQKAPPELNQKIWNRLTSKLQDIWASYPDLKSPTMGALYSYSDNPRVNDLEYLHWRRHGRPLHEDIVLNRRDDLEALSRINRTNVDYLRRRRGKGVKDFKVDENHWTLLEAGYDFGLNELRSEELANCFDALCPCCKVHDPDALKKQRKRLRIALRK